MKRLNTLTFLLIIATTAGSGYGMASHGKPAVKGGVGGSPSPKTYGFVNDARLGAVRSDYPNLASRVIPTIASRRKLNVVIRQSGIAWGKPDANWQDITNDVLLLLKNVPRNSSASLNSPQRKAAEQVLLALRTLKSATDIGITYDQYGERLIEAKTSVESNFRGVPTSEVKTELQLAFKAYLDAYTTWKTVNQAKASGDESVAYTRRREDQQPLTPSEKVMRQFERSKEDETRHRENARPLREKWDEAATHFHRAEQLLNGK